MASRALQLGNCCHTRKVFNICTHKGEVVDAVARLEGPAFGVPQVDEGHRVDCRLTDSAAVSIEQGMGSADEDRAKGVYVGTAE